SRRSDWDVARLVQSEPWALRPRARSSHTLCIQWSIVDPDEVGRLSGDGGIVGEDNGDWLPGETDTVLGQEKSDSLRRGVVPGVIGELGSCDDLNDAGDLLGSL